MAVSDGLLLTGYWNMTVNDGLFVTWILEHGDQ
jgi:hypothetical protein